MAEIISNYFLLGWRERVLDCPCGWGGDSRAMRMVLQETVTDYACAQCDGTLLIVAHPDLELVRRAADEGNAEARMQLDLVEEARQHFAARTPDPG